MNAHDQRFRIVGVGLDPSDGHVRLSRGDNFDLYAGSETTHEKMLEACIRLNRRIEKEGIDPSRISREELARFLSEGESA